MKKSNHILSISIALATLLLSGCGSSGDDNTEQASNSSVTVKYADGTTFGETCGTLVTGDISGYSLCEVGTTNVKGFIRLDTTITDINGALVNECSPDFDISLLENSDISTVGTCTLVSSTSSTTSSVTTPATTSTTSTPSTSTPSTTTSTDNYDPNEGATTETIARPDQPTCSNIQPHLLPACTGASGEVPAN